MNPGVFSCKVALILWVREIHTGSHDKNTCCSRCCLCIHRHCNRGVRAGSIRCHRARARNSDADLPAGNVCRLWNLDCRVPASEPAGVRDLPAATRLA